MVAERARPAKKVVDSDHPQAFEATASKTPSAEATRKPRIIRGRIMYRIRLTQS